MVYEILFDSIVFVCTVVQTTWQNIRKYSYMILGAYIIGAYFKNGKI